MKNYVDGFVIPVRKDKIEDYLKIANKAGEIWRDHGAIEYYECIGDDLDIKDMTLSFPKMAGASDDETIVFAWIAYKSREHRDEVNAKVMEDPRMKEMMNPDSNPFDCKRMACGGFATRVKY